MGGRFAIELVYMAAAVLLILGLKRLSGVKTALAGNRLASLGMGLAVGATLFLLWRDVSPVLLFTGVAVGAIVGYLLATKTPMTSMPELVAFFNGMGGAASAFVALAETTGYAGEGARGTVAEAGGTDFAIALVVSVLIGSVTLSGSLIAYAKLAGKIWKNRFLGLGGQALNALLAVVALALCVWAGFFVPPEAVGGAGVMVAFVLLAVVALLLGIGLSVPIGGADMPVVISLLNSYSGLAASATGFVLQNNLLIIAGTLVGAAGLILTQIMCKAMNRSLANVLFGGLGADEGAKKEDSGYTKVKSTTAEEVAPILDAARSLIVVPGYGLAVAQAQHKVRELADLLAAKGCDVKYGIHPVAGRMPGHMNVLLAEADVPYEQLYDLDQINSEFKNADVVLVIGANDVCNPAANDDPTSPIAGMPVLDVWDAQTVIVIKRSLSPGYAGIPNELFQLDNTLMLFSDAKQALEEMVVEVQEL